MAGRARTTVGRRVVEPSGAAPGTAIRLLLNERLFSASVRRAAEDGCGAGYEQKQGSHTGRGGAGWARLRWGEASWGSVLDKRAREVGLTPCAARQLRRWRPVAWPLSEEGR